MFGRLTSILSQDIRSLVISMLLFSTAMFNAVILIIN